MLKTSPFSPTGYLGVCFLILCLLAVPVGVSVARAQGTPVAGSTLSEEELARLSDAELRAYVLDHLAPVPPPPSAAASMMNPARAALDLEERLDKVRARLGEIFETQNQIPDAVMAVWAALVEGRGGGGVAAFALAFLGSIGVGWLAAALLGRRLNGRGGGAEDWPFRRKCVHFVGTMFGKVLSVLVFAGVTTLVFFLVNGQDQRDRMTFAFYLSALVFIWLIDGFGRAYLRPGEPEKRIPVFTDREAHGIYWSLATTVVLGAFGFFTCALFWKFGIIGDVHLLFLLIDGVIIALGLCVTFLTHGAAFTRDLGGEWRGERGNSRRAFAAAYPWCMVLGALGLLAAVFSLTLIGRDPPFGAALGTVGLLTLLPSLDAAAAREGRLSLARGDEIAPAVIRVTRIALGLGFLTLLALLWDVDPLTSTGMMSDSLQEAVLRGGLEIGLVILITYAAWQALRIWVDRGVAAEDAARLASGIDQAEGEVGGTGLSRMRTLLPLIKRAGQASLAVIALMVVLSALGVDIGPLLAGAGVVGLAVGFGSQTLVRDIVSGAFFLMDDAFRLGEYVDLGTVKGSVERIAIRSLQLRHHRGAVHTVPFGEIQTLTNYSRDWAIMKLRFRVPFDTDTERARKIVKAVGTTLMDHPDIGEDFLQPFKSQGVVEVDDYGLVLSTKFMCKPGRQFLIRRYAYAEVQKAFAENGIQFARPEVRVSLSEEDKTRSDADGRIGQAVGAAVLALESGAKGAARGTDGLDGLKA
ncbi:MAG: mechanosensitive ion channel family protein [Rhodospirillum sp.]|nr:mechanosensitive ion channel family protein [Rhodospirillum sp.]MCF8490138.1 mechanosensitive ion channel family protein [Rhodospirillum sp.]